MDGSHIHGIATHLEKTPQVIHPFDTAQDAAKCVSQLSTILVATIQEVKDRISQIEYVFCTQLYPYFHKNAKSQQLLFSEAKRAAEEEWKERECQLDHLLKQLSHDKEQALEDYKVDKSKLLTKIAQLEEKLSQKTIQVDNLIETNTSIIINKEKHMKEYEERINFLLSKLEGIEGSYNAVNKELQEKNEELAKEKDLKQGLLKQIESQALKITSNEQAAVTNKQLAMEQANMVASLDDLRDQLKTKAIDLEEGNKLREQLVQQVNDNGIELKKKDQQLSAHEREKILLLSRINDLENKVVVLEDNLKDESRGISKRSEYHDDLVQQIQQLNAELLAERQKCKEVVAAYKKLKSEHNYLLTKVPLNKEDMLRQIKSEGENDPSSHNTARPEIKNRTPVSKVVAGELNKVKKETDSIEISDDQKGSRLNKSRNSASTSTSKSHASTHWITNRKSGSSSGTKRPASGWRDTRSRQSPGGPDPHDDFLDTPYENIRGNLHKAMKDNTHDIPAQVSKDMDSDTSGDETQDLQAESGSKKQQLLAPRPGSKDFKFVEPVRKKSERQNLNGIECKQCKKFYDAVLPDGEGKNGEVDNRNLRCEHHDGVSRHRYRYVPPMTPEGFWNIGFDTEN